MKLIKLKQDHFIIVDETIQPVKGYYYDYFINKIRNTNWVEYGEANHCWQITHSTQPLYKNSFFYRNDFWGIQELNLSEVKELIGEVDVKKKVKDYVEELIDCKSVKESERTWISAICYQMYNQAIEDNKEKKYTEEYLRKAIEMAQSQYWDVENRGFSTNTEGDWSFKYTEEEIIQSLQPETEWEVEIVDGKLKLKF